jgi:hypothetical protein
MLQHEIGEVSVIFLKLMYIIDSSTHVNLFQKFKFLHYLSQKQKKSKLL